MPAKVLSRGEFSTPHPRQRRKSRGIIITLKYLRTKSCRLDTRGSYGVQPTASARENDTRSRSIDRSIDRSSAGIPKAAPQDAKHSLDPIFRGSSTPQQGECQASPAKGGVGKISSRRYKSGPKSCGSVLEPQSLLDCGANLTYKQNKGSHDLAHGARVLSCVVHGDDMACLSLNVLAHLPGTGRSCWRG